VPSTKCFVPSFCKEKGTPGYLGFPRFHHRIGENAISTKKKNNVLSADQLLVLAYTEHGRVWKQIKEAKGMGNVCEMYTKAQCVEGAKRRKKKTNTKETKN
jgi:hypothetical protein